MSNDPKTNLPWGIQQVKPGSMKTISEQKLATFAVGQQKKSRFQKAREEKEEKKRQEEAEAAKIYDSFVASFAVEEDKTFVRGGRIQDDDPNSVFGGRVGDVYKLGSSSGTDSVPSSSSRTGKKKGDMANLLEEMKERELERSGNSRPRSSDKASSNSSSATTSSSTTKQIDSFLNEINTTSSTANKLSASSDLSTMFSLPTSETTLDKGSFDTGDPSTTNLYVGNLAPSVTEELLNEIFGKFGPINSVKVMWPRSEEERLRKRNCGFVSFKSRRDAEDALNELNDSTLEGHILSIGWGKPVKISSTPFVLPSASIGATPSLGQSTATFFAQFGQHSAVSAMGGANMPIPRDVVGINRPPLGHSHPPPPPPYPMPPCSSLSSASGKTGGGRWDVHSGAPPHAMQQAPFTASQPLQQQGNDVEVHVKIPENQALRKRIDVTAKFVATDGEAFEQAIVYREQTSPSGDYGFLLETVQPGEQLSDAALYYKWRTYAYLMGESDDVWSQNPFKMVSNGPLWVPPPCKRGRTRANSYGDGTGRRRRSRSYSPASTPTRGKRGRSRSRSRSRSRERSSKDARRRDRDRPIKDASEVSERWDRDSTRESDAYAGMTGAQIERAKAQRRGESSRFRLRSDDYEYFLDLLENLTVSRESIRDAMGFALDNSDACEEVIGLLKDSILEENIPYPLKVARLYLISDILHNSGAAVKNASLYRNAIQNCLPDVFHSFNEVLRNVSGRMTANQIEERVISVLRVWYDWTIFPTSYIHGLEAVFLQTESDINRFSKMMPSGGESAVEDLEKDIESLRRKARMSGLSIGMPSGKDQEIAFFDALTLHRKLAYVSEFTAIKEAALGIERSGGQPDNERGDTVDGDDIDGVPLEGNSDDDIDGVPFEEEEEEQEGDIERYDKDDVRDDYEDDDDIDGIPFEEGDDDDVDGVPFEDDDDDE